MKGKYFISICVSLVFIIVFSSFTFSKIEEKTDATLVQKNNMLQNDMKKEEEYKIYSYITDEMQQKAQDVTPVILCYARAYTPEYLNEIASHIVVARVISIDEMDVSYSLFGMTKGKLLINNSLKGDFKNGQVVSFGKLGGIIDAQTIIDVQGEECSYTNEEPKSKIYFNLIREFDINIEEGKTYLLYLSYNEHEDVYEILGLKYGLREINIPQEKDTISLINVDFSKLELKNNDTNEFENLQEYIDKYI